MFLWLNLFGQQAKHKTFPNGMFELLQNFSPWTSGQANINNLEYNVSKAQCTAIQLYPG